MNLKLSLLVVAVATLIGLPICSARLREFEESCNLYKPTENCRPDLDLVCHDNVCACKDHAFYDPERKACVVQISQTCTKEEHSYGYSAGTYHTITRCPLNAVCELKDPNKAPDIPDTLKNYDDGTSQTTSTTRCLCKRGFYPGDTKLNCIQALGHNVTCSAEVDKTGKMCDSAAGLVCADSGTCLCNAKENTHYDEKTRRCLTKVNDACSPSTFCDRNSICSTILERFKSRYNRMWGGNPTGEPEQKSDTGKNTGECTCLPGFTMNPQGKCAGSFSVTCSVENPCNSDKFLSCVDGICQCQAGSHQAFSHEENSTCVLLPGSSCHADKGPKCIVNSACSETGHCQCDAGFSESPSGKCLLSYENECKIPDNQPSPTPYNYRPPRPQIKGTHNESCNFYQGLSCKGTKCECFDSELKWDSKRKMCTAGVNERCGSVAMMRTSEFDYQHEMFYPTASLTRRYYSGNFAYISAYFVACAEGLTCTKDHNEIEGWRVCEKKA